jgi:hypothetical protein
VPTLIIGGTNSTIPQYLLAETVERMPDAGSSMVRPRVVVVPGTWPGTAAAFAVPVLGQCDRAHAGQRRPAGLLDHRPGRVLAALAGP